MSAPIGFGPTGVRLTAAKLFRRIACISLIGLSASFVALGQATHAAAAQSAGSKATAVQALFESELAILRVEDNHARVVGTGFIIRQNPLRILTCFHVVSEGSALNSGPVVYAIARRPESSEEIDLRKVAMSFLKVQYIVFKPEYDLAILQIDPHSEEAAARKMDLAASKPLTLSFDNSERTLGTTVTWLTTAAEGELTLTPRLFTGNIVASYISDERYGYKPSSGPIAQQIINGAKMLEIDKLFLPGASGSPILNAETNAVIGYVHGYRAFALTSNIEATDDVELAENSDFKKEKLKHKLPLVTSISLAIDLRTAEDYLRQEGYVAK